MNEPFNDELISAYLDGELTAEEQSLVEQTLMDSVEHRAVFDELRSLRGSLQALPTHKLPLDFSQRVLRRAEEAIQSAQAGPEKTQPAKPVVASVDSPAPVVVNTSKSSQESFKFGFAVAAFAALAASLLVALYVPKIEVSPLAGRGAPKTEVAVGKKFEGVPAKPQGRANTPTVVPQPERQAGPAKKLDETVGLRQLTEQDEQVGAPAPAVAKGGVGQPAVPGEKESLANESPVKKSPATESSQGASNHLGQDADRPAKADAKPPAAVVAADDLAKVKTEDLAESEMPFVVVRFSCTRAALESGAFDRVLKEHNIQFEDASAEGESADAALGKGLADLKRRESRQLSDRVSAEGVDVVVVEATRAQIDGVLADFQAQQDRFLGVASQSLAREEFERPLLLSASVHEKAALGKEGVKRSLAASEPNRNRAAKEAGGLGGAGGGLPAAGAALPAPDSPHGFAPTPAAPAKPGAALGPAPLAGGKSGGKPGDKPDFAKDGLNGAEFKREHAEEKAAKLKKSLEERAKNAKQLELREESKPAAETPALETKYADAEFGSAPAGKANRIAPARFREYDRMEFRKQDGVPYGARRRGDEGKSLERLSPADADGAGGRGGEEGAKKAEAQDKSRDRAYANLDALQNGKLDVASGNLAAGDTTDRFKRSASPAGQERVRVLFVIRAVEQEAPAEAK